MQTVSNAVNADAASAPRYTFFHAGPFSQWHMRTFTHRGQRMLCAEQGMMYEKAVVFGDMEMAARIMAVPAGRECASLCKQLGREVRGFSKPVWDKVARQFVFQVNFSKFTQHSDLLHTLLRTEGTVLVEASPRDRIWGIGLAAHDPRALDPAQWLGTNWLGQVLTSLRDGLILARRAVESLPL